VTIYTGMLDDRFAQTLPCALQIGEDRFLITRWFAEPAQWHGYGHALANRGYGALDPGLSVLENVCPEEQRYRR
jgi:hypothetical protein